MNELELEWDFQTIEYDASSNPINVRHYSTFHQSDIASIANGMTVITVTTAKDHNIAIAWSASINYGLGVRVVSNNRFYVSQEAGNLNHNPLSSDPDGDAHWLLDESYTGKVDPIAMVAISDVVGMTDLNGKFAVVSTPTTKTFVVTLATAQTYTSGGHIKAGVFQFRNLMKYNATNDAIETEILYT
jgi:hypothetical protein